MLLRPTARSGMPGSLIILALLALISCPLFADEDQKSEQTILAPIAGRPAEQSASFPEEIKPGVAMVYPSADKSAEVGIGIYLPSHYEPNRKWPLLVSAVQPEWLRREMQGLIPQAEMHGFAFIVVEARSLRGSTNESGKAWTREGEATIQSLTFDNIQEFLEKRDADIAEVLGAVRKLNAAASLEPRAVGCTAFFGTGALVYRMALMNPNVFNIAIMRSAIFQPELMPERLSPEVRKTNFMIIFGEKENQQTLPYTEQAIAYLKTLQIENVTAEKIPNSGLDPRPEIVGNYFRGASEKNLGEDAAKFLRLANQAGAVLNDTWSEALTGRPADAVAAATARQLVDLAEEKPRGEHAAPARLLAARLQIEKLRQPARGKEYLEMFTKAPLRASPYAPEATYLLVKNFYPPQTEPQQAIKLLSPIARRAAVPLRAEMVKMMTEARAALAEQKKNKE